MDASFRVLHVWHMSKWTLLTESHTFWSVSKRFWGCTVFSALYHYLSLCVHQELNVCTRGHTTTPVVRWPPGWSCDPRFTQPACLLFLQSQVSVVYAGQQHQLGLHTVSLSGGKLLLSFSFFSPCFLVCSCPPLYSGFGGGREIDVTVN